MEGRRRKVTEGYNEKYRLWNFPGGASDKKKKCLSMQETEETQFQFLDQADSLEKGMATHPVFLPGESHGWWTLAGYSS